MNFIRVVLLSFVLLIAGHMFGQYGKISGTISDEFGPLPGASVELIGKNQKTSCDANGNYSFKVEPGNYKVQASYVMYQTELKEVTITFINLDAELIFTLEAGNIVDENIKIGSRSDPRSQLETAVAVDIISPDFFEGSSQTSLAQIIQYKFHLFILHPRQYQMAQIILTP